MAEGSFEAHRIRVDEAIRSAREEIDPEVMGALSDINVNIFNQEVAVVNAERGIEDSIAKGIAAYPRMGREWLDYLEAEQQKKGASTIVATRDPDFKMWSLELKYVNFSPDDQKNALRDFWLTLKTHDPRGEITKRALDAQPKPPPVVPQPAA